MRLAFRSAQQARKADSHWEIARVTLRVSAMTDIRATSIMVILTIGAFAVTDLAAQGGRGRGGLPGATPEQTQAVVAMNAALTEHSAAVTTARAELATVTFAPVKNVAGITAAVEKLRAAELALATKRAEEFA